MTISDLTDLSSPEPVVKWSEAWWENAKPEVRAHRCKAHRKNGEDANAPQSTVQTCVPNTVDAHRRSVQKLSAAWQKQPTRRPVRC